MTRGLAGRLDRVAAKLGRVADPPLVIVFQETDGRGVPVGPEVVETVDELPSGVRIVRRQRPHVVVITERPDGPQ